MNKSILPNNNTTKIKYIKNLNKKRGRHIKDNIIKGRKKPHDRTCPCNIRTRITIAYLSFIPKFINSVSELLLCEEDGIDINQYKLKNIKPNNPNNKVIEKTAIQEFLICVFI